MAQHDVLQYIRLKIIVTLLRAFVRLTWKSYYSRDQALMVREGVQRELVRIPSRDPGRHSSSSSSSSPPSPVVVNWHASGFVFPLLGTEAYYCARLAKSAGVVVVDADYRKGPEDPFPAATHDVEDVLRWVATARRDLDRSRVTLSGSSAGGTLALVAATTIRNKLAVDTDVQLRVPLVVAYYPLTDMAQPPASKHVVHPIRPHPVWALELFNDCYCPDRDLRAHPDVSPSFAAHANFPPTVALLTADGDTVMPEAAGLASKLEKENNTRGCARKINVVHHVFQGVPHAFDKGAKEGSTEWEAREEAYELTIKLVKEASK